MSKKQARNTQPAKPAGMKKLEHRGYTVVQSPRNHHVMIGKDGRRVYHAPVDHPLTDEELRQQVDDYITIMGIADTVAAGLQKSTQRKRNKPCQGCPDRYPACSDHCKKPEYIAWKTEQNRIREARQRESHIWGYTAREIRKNRRVK